MQYRLTLRVAAAIAAVTALAMGIADGAAAQTLVDPSSKAAPSRPPPLAAKSRPGAHVQPCSAYGVGFIEIPETGACIKIGGSVTVESTINRAR